MAIQPKTAALITAGVAVSAGIAYMVYFDHKRRNDPNLKKKLSKCSNILIVLQRRGGGPRFLYILVPIKFWHLHCSL